MSQMVNTISVSTWSLNRTLGRFVADNSAVDGGPFMDQPAEPPSQTLLQLIPEIATRGYTMLQICHFHLESQDPLYLERLRSALVESGITLEMLLIDDGDLTDPDIDRHLAWYHSWLDTAERLGARRARVCVGRQTPTPERLTASGQHLASLAAQHPNLRLVTENWLEMTPDAQSVQTVLDVAGEHVGLMIDLGNWHGEDKYAQLAAIAGRAESCHAKCHFDSSGPNEDDFRKTLTILKDAGYSGPLTLIYDGPNQDEWAGLETEKDIVRSVLA